MSGRGGTAGDGGQKRRKVVLLYLPSIDIWEDLRLFHISNVKPKFEARYGIADVRFMVMNVPL